MGFNIKNNYGPNIEVKDGGKLTLVQGKDGLWNSADAEDAEFEEVKEDEESQPVLEDVKEVAAGKENISPKLVVPVTEVAKSFRFQSGFVKNKVADIIRDYYKGSHANLALIEIALYDHKLLIRRNYHKPFVKALVAWNLIEVAGEEELKKIVSAVTDKHNRMPKVGYQKWDDNHADDKSFCEKIGRELGDSMPYSG